MAEGLSPGDLATLSLLDPEQGVCPDGHRCRLDHEPGFRMCEVCDYRGRALICWQITPEAINAAERAGALPGAIDWARCFLTDKS